MGLTTDRNDPDIGYGVDGNDPENKKVAQHKKYLVLSEDELAKGFIRPVRTTYLHSVCGATTSMHQTIAETYARQPSFYGATYCGTCGQHRPVGAEGEFAWLDGEKVGT